MTSLPGAAPAPLAPDFGNSAAGAPRSASVWPLIVGVFALVASALIAIFLQRLGAQWWSLVGYGLTPLAAVLATGWDAVGQLSGQRDPWFVIKPHLSRILRILAGLSIVLGVVHIWRISEWLARSAVQYGWPFFS